ncbi:MAG: LysR family transcriptional regulator [Sulfuriflexus sp.]|nr:LysR family transcriptional regulator [Sulfuriflexus sp.]
MEYKKLPDLKGLVTLKAVVELGGVDEAAKELNIGQPAVTKRLRALDNCYGVPLMLREGRRLELSSAGERVYQYARLVIDHQTSLMDDLDQLRAGQNKLRLEATFAIGEHVLPEQLLRFAETWPQYRIESRLGYTRRIQTRLATGLADMALLEQAPDHPDILVQKWLDDELLLVCGPNHPLWGSGALDKSELVNLDYVLRETKSSMRTGLDKALREIGIEEIPTAMEVGSTHTIVEILGRGRYVSFLPRFAVQESLDAGSLYHIKTTGLDIKRTLWIARSRANIQNPVADAFVDVLLGNH